LFISSEPTSADWMSSVIRIALRFWPARNKKADGADLHSVGNIGLLCNEPPGRTGPLFI